MRENYGNAGAVLGEVYIQVGVCTTTYVYRGRVISVSHVDGDVDLLAGEGCRVIDCDEDGSLSI